MVMSVVLAVFMVKQQPILLIPQLLSICHLQFLLGALAHEGFSKFIVIPFSDFVNSRDLGDQGADMESDLGGFLNI